MKTFHVVNAFYAVTYEGGGRGEGKGERKGKERTERKKK